ncbi:glycosyltransferase 87 family protein [Rugosimonospora africana]|uniref:Membrane protein n=1 Tax=Rugosimonospora africana TaxID=556532 RepID=A0A8J3QZI4_9ACTN|nr:glycosyltransferase 87 family protein [Rugosimonospora africana]GIH17481.1 membrane protein [Rugosimonospora africana]
MSRDREATSSTLIALGLFAGSAALLTYGLLHLHSPGYLYDSDVYRHMGGERVLRHMPLYGDADPSGLSGLFTYPPFAALLFTAIVRVPAPVYALAFPAACAAALLASVWLSLRLVGRTTALRGAGWARGVAEALVLAAILLWIQPVRWTMFLGQINLFLLAMVLADFAAPRRRWYRGIAIGLAAGVKLTPALFIVHLLVTRQFRAAVTAVVTFLGTVGVALAVLPRDSVVFWRRAVFDTHRVGPQSYHDNQSLAGMLTRNLNLTELPTATGLAVSAGVAAAGLGVAWFADKRRHVLAGVCAVGVTGLLVSPISWSHHWVWFVPVFVLAWATALRLRPGNLPAVLSRRRWVFSRWRSALVLAGVGTGWFLLSPPGFHHLTDRDPHLPRWVLHQAWYQALSRDIDVWLGIAALAAIAVVAVHGSAPVPQPTPDAGSTGSAESLGSGERVR